MIHRARLLIRLRLALSLLCGTSLAWALAPLPWGGEPVALAQAGAPVANGGMVTIESDSQQADNVTGIVTATGNVRITYPEKGMVATSRQAQYFSKEGRLVLTGDVDVIDADGQRIRAERLTYRLDSERLVAEPQPGRQVNSRLKIRQESGNPAAAPPVLP